MRIVCVGGGPAGFYFAISTKLRDPAHEVTVIERDPPGATYGWGVVYWDNLLDVFFRNDPASARDIRAQSTLWQEQRISVEGAGAAYLAGYGFSMQRAALLDILARRAIALGVRVEYRHEIDDLGPFADADLIVASDGANSRVRQAGGDLFGTSVTTGSNPYIWLGTDRFFDSFAFAFERTPAGWIWCHAYPSSAGLSTCIVECTRRTWEGLGFDERGDEDTLRELEKIFAEPLDGHALISQCRGRTARWQRFTEITNQRWYHDNVVLLGDAAHTTHFTLGSGTALAIVDAVMLAQILYDNNDDLTAALRSFDARGRMALHPVQAAARTSMAWFEQADRYLDRDAVSFAYAMAGRHGRQPPWRYQVHRATQVPAIRRALRGLHSGSRWCLARRRGEPAPSRAKPPVRAEPPARADR
ncbi:FAD-dependent monooxygenase [Frankia sp. QA3]|uniref:FAD-dependent monooxygenase n=1 Tax=Frankia sp. QA3 TaxID=710111 RepID=UPI000269BB1E|nr:FAD-dependent monooxygenase [Frankia sp. QA3]EIV91192.1 2-polyprenyl-6-methoxyphenol hydroxylase-like oxidoreductase [Frankia sp. QA3]